MKGYDDMVKDFAEKFGLAIRIAMLIVSVSFGMVVILAGATAARAAALKSESVISGDYIRLGDIFEGVKNADYVLGPAPQPGKDMILNARTLYKIASALDVDWQPGSSAEQLILRREAVVIPQAEIASFLSPKIKEAGVDNNFTIDYTTAIQDIILPIDTERTMEVSSFSFDPQKDTFNAVIVAPSADNPVRRMNLSGRIERTVSVPVLKNSLKNGEIIGSLDIDYIEIPQNRIMNGTVLEEKDIINMTPRRVMASGKPILINDLESPKMVDRGDMITLVFANGPMMLTVKGKSLQAGALGDTIRVSNLDSNRNLQGVVTAHREVTIR